MSVYPSNSKFGRKDFVFRDQGFVDVYLLDGFGCTLLHEEFYSFDSRILSIYVKKLLDKEGDQIMIKPRDVSQLDLFFESDSNII